VGPLDDEPWRPFSTREDFAFAELIHDAKLNRGQIEGFIKLIQRCQESPGLFTFNTYNDLKKTLDRAQKILTEVSVRLLPPLWMTIHDQQFEKHDVVCEFKGEEKTYETWCRPLWNWILDHLIDPELIQHFEWDAQKVFRFSGGKFTQIFTEPSTGNRLWDIQVRNSHPSHLNFT
jgi:hypothetical protein